MPNAPPKQAASSGAEQFTCVDRLRWLFNLMYTIERSEIGSLYLKILYLLFLALLMIFITIINAIIESKVFARLGSSTLLNIKRWMSVVMAKAITI